MNPYQDLLDGLESLRQNQGGSREERIATAALVYALFHRALVNLKRDLRRRDFDAEVYEDAVYVSLRVQGRTVKVSRLSGQNRVAVELLGFANVRGPGRTDFELSALPDEVCAAEVEKTILAISKLLLQDMAQRGR